MPAIGSSLVFVGTYSQKYGHVDGKGEGIYAFTMNDRGELTPMSAIRGIVGRGVPRGCSRAEVALQRQ
jgi:hypothetical protein